MSSVVAGFSGPILSASGGARAGLIAKLEGTEAEVSQSAILTLVRTQGVGSRAGAQPIAV